MASAGLRHIADCGPGITRRRAGRGFAYRLPDGTPLVDRAALRRIRALAVPPAWTEVWICPFAAGHLQATGRDARNRKQYRYHPRFRELCESTKFEHVMTFAAALPALRAKLHAHMAEPGLPRRKMLATVVYLLDKTLIRVGNDDYVKQNNSYGLTTLKNRHVEVTGSAVRFHFIGKSGRQWSLQFRDRRVAKIIRACQELPGQELLQYRAEDGSIQNVTSSDVNAYLREMTGKDVTAKDFRTWAGTVLAATALCHCTDFQSAAEAKRKLRAAIAQVAARLGNTATICRKCYVHPEVIKAYLDGELALQTEARAGRRRQRRNTAMAPEEAAVLAFLRSRLKRTGRSRKPAGGENAAAVRRQLAQQLRASAQSHPTSPHVAVAVRP